MKNTRNNRLRWLLVLLIAMLSYIASCLTGVVVYGWNGIPSSWWVIWNVISDVAVVISGGFIIVMVVRK